jgi:N-6 DNA Methylase
MSELTVSTKGELITKGKLNEGVLRDLLRGFETMEVNEDLAFIASLHVLAWAKLSQNANLADRLALKEYDIINYAEKLNYILMSSKDRLNYSFPNYIKELNDEITQISKLDGFTESGNSARIVLHNYYDENIYETINVIKKYPKTEIFGTICQSLDFEWRNLLEKFDIHSYLNEAPSKYTRNFASPLPIEIVNLMIGLAGNINGKNIYCPWDNLSEFGSILDVMGAKASIEIVQASVFPWFVNFFNETNVEILIGNPIQNPGFLLDGKLSKFDVSIAFPPLNIKYNPSFSCENWRDRFPEKTGSGAVLNIRHVLAQTQGKVIMAVPNSLLFSSGVEQSLRQDLLEKNQVEAVISLPPALLHQTQIPFSIIVLDTQSRSSNLASFVNGNDERFFVKDGRGRSQLVNWEDLLDTLRKGEDESSVVRVPVQKILENNSYLEVSAYILPPERKKIERVLNGSKIANLNKLVDFVRPPLKQKVVDDRSPDRGTQALEVTIGDFSEYGYAQTPTRTVTTEKYISTDSDDFLKPRDILIAVKANTGKVAIVSDAAESTGDTPWIANQSCLILRQDRS